MRNTHTMRKRRTGNWCSVGQGAGSVQDTGDADDDDSTDNDDPMSPEERKKLSNEAKRRRLQAKEWQKRAEAAEAKLAENGRGTAGPDPSEVILTLVEAGMSKDRIRAAIKLVDWSSVTDVDDAIDELRDEHPFLFLESSGSKLQQELPGQGGRGNGNKNGKGGGPSNAELIGKYSALRPAHGRI